MITDCHLHSFAKTAARQSDIYVPPARDIHDYMDEAAPLGVRRAVVVQASVDKTDNSRLMDVLSAKGPVALRGVAMIDAAADLLALNAAGVRATRIQDRIAEMLPGLPEGMRLVLDHVGHVDPTAPDTIFRLLQTDRVWVKLSPTRISSDIGRYGDLVALIERIGTAFPEQIIWGSDWPVLTLAAPYEDWFNLAQSFTRNHGAEGKVFGQNTLAAYGLSPVKD